MESEERKTTQKQLVFIELLENIETQIKIEEQRCGQLIVELELMKRILGGGLVK